MPAERRYYRLTCQNCSAAIVVSPDKLISSLREAGMLRRQKEPSVDVIEALLPTASARLRCPQCREHGVTWGYVDDLWDDEAWGQGRACEACGQTIPAERVELFPNVQLCVSCQRAEETGVSSEEPEFCPRCGSLMTMRLRRGAGIAGYQMYCPDCRR